MFGMTTLHKVPLLPFNLQLVTLPIFFMPFVEETSIVCIQIADRIISSCNGKHHGKMPFQCEDHNYKV